MDGLFDIFDLVEDENYNYQDQYSNTNNTTRRITTPAPPKQRDTGNLVGLLNQGTTCYMNSLLQVLFMTYEFREQLYKLPSIEIGEFEELIGNNDLPKVFNEKVVRRIPIRLRELFAQLQESKLHALSTTLLTDSFGWKNNNIGIQHDIMELNHVLIDAIHRSIIDIPNGDQFIPSLFNGILVNRLVCWGCGKERDREEIFQDINLQVEGCSSILNSFENYVSPVELSGDNSYECDFCTIENKKGKQEARMAMSFRKLPIIFTIALSRFGFNWDTMQRHKINSKCSFPLILDLSPYCEENVSRSLRKDSSDSNIKLSMDKNLKSIPCENLMTSVIDENSEHLYDLTAVVVHTGSAHGGHYYAYIKDR